MKEIFIFLLFTSLVVQGQGNVTVSNGKSLTINKEGSLIMTQNFSNSGTVTLNSDSNEFSSMIVGGSSSGNIIYNRYVNIAGTGEWDLIGSPVSGVTINSFITETNNADAIATNGSSYAVGSYDNTLDTWTNATTSTAGNLNLGEGYQMARIAIRSSHNESVFMYSRANILVIRGGRWSLSNYVKSNLHNLNGTMEISGVTYTITGVEITGNKIEYNVTPNPEDNGINGNGYVRLSASTNYDTGTSATLAFTGTVATADQTVAVQNNNAANAGAGRRWNLIANPFPSYLNGNDDADATHNFLTVNADKLDTSFTAIYGYKADGTGYTIYNHAYNSDTPVYIAPGQGFFIAANNTSPDTVRFTEAMQTVTGGDDFIAAKSENTSYQLVLEIHNNTSKTGETQFYFKEGLTLGLDPGYDAGAFNKTAPISSRLVEEEQGVNFTINAMGVTHMNSTTIPLVINQQKGQAFKVGIANKTISEDINVYLEDTLNETMTLLQEQDFELTAKSEISAAGRFYLHLTTAVLANEDSLNTTLVNVFKGAGNNFVTIEGLESKAIIKLYSILGKEVRAKAITTSNETLSTNGLSSGIYIIQLKSNNQLLTKKIQID